MVYNLFKMDSQLVQIHEGIMPDPYLRIQDIEMDCVVCQYENLSSAIQEILYFFNSSSLISCMELSLSISCR